MLYSVWLSLTAAVACGLHAVASRSNAQYGQRDPKRRESCPRAKCCKQFIDRILMLDSDGVISGVRTEHRKLILAILDDAYLGDYFWRDPSLQRALQTQRDKRDADWGPVCCPPQG